MSSRHSRISIQKPCQTRIIAFQDLPPLSSSLKEAPVSREIATYLQTILEQDQQCACILLPSLSSLSQRFNAPQCEIRNALLLLRAEGFDSFTPGLYGHISLWPRNTDYFPIPASSGRSFCDTDLESEGLSD
jgi:hypothetical protein